MRHLLHKIAIVVCFALIGGSASTGCSSKPKRSKPGIPSEPITAESPRAQTRFDEALRGLEEGEYAAAREEFRLLQADFPNDPIAVLSELYIARAGLGDLDLNGDADDAPGRMEALEILSSLSDDEGVDGRIRYAALLYYGAGLATLGSFQEALLALKDYPGASLGPVVLQRDRTKGWALIAESFQRAARWHDAALAYAGLYSTASRSDGDSTLMGLATSRGFDVALNHLEDDVLQGLLTEDDSFLRAIAGWALLKRGIRGEPTDDEKKALEELHQRVAPDLVEIGEADRARESAMAVAGWGPVRRLAIGLYVPLSGENRRVGRKAVEGALLAQDALNASQEARLTLVIQDSAAPADEALERFVDAEVRGVIGPLEKDAAEKAAEFAQDHQLPLLLLTAQPHHTQADLADNYVFRLFIDARSEAEAAARVATRDGGDSRVAIVHPDIGYGRRMARWFGDAFTERGGSVVIEAAYDRASSNYESIAARVARAKPDAIFIPDTSAKAAEVTAFLAQQNVWGIPTAKRPQPASRRIQVHYYGTSLWEDPRLLRQAGSYLEGAVIPAWSSSTYATQRSNAFYAAYAERFGRAPEDVAAFAYDATELFRRLLLDRGTVRGADIRSALTRPRLYKGVTGPVRFRPSGEPVRPLRFVTIRGGEFVRSDYSVVMGVETGEASSSEVDADDASN